MRIGKRNLKIEKMRKKEIKKMKVNGKKIKTWFSRHIKRLFCYIFVFYGSFVIFLLKLPLRKGNSSYLKKGFVRRYVTACAMTTAPSLSATMTA